MLLYEVYSYYEVSYAMIHALGYEYMVYEVGMSCFYIL